MDISIFIGIALLLLSAKIFGELAERLNISSMVGEITGGIVVGPLLHLVTPNAFISQLAGFGILFLLFIIGLSTRFDEVKGHVYSGSVLAFGGEVISFAGGFLVGYFLFGSIEAGIIIGVAILSTSTAVTIRAISDIGHFHTPVGKILLAIDMADEVVAMLALSVLTSYFTYGSIHVWYVVGLFFAIIGFFIFILTFGSDFVGKFLGIFQRMRDEQILISIPLVIVFIVAFLSENVGLAGVTGAFLAGMAMNKASVTEHVILPKVKIIGYGFFIPLFFAYSALILDFGALVKFWWIIAILIAIGIAAKLAGSGFLAKLYGFKKREQMMIGFGMVPRGEYAIITVQIAATLPLVATRLTAEVATQIYTVIVAFVLISMIITPLLLKLVVRK
jgi:Kef-type K+ transport system membrane component KefB